MVMPRRFSSQRFHERGLAVIDMSRCAYDDRFHLAGILPETS
jgi:hypothetical protein